MKLMRMVAAVCDAAVTLMLKVLDGSEPSSSELTTTRTKIDTKCLLATNKNIRIGQLAD